MIKLISKDSIEESMFKVAVEKLNLEQQVTGGGGNGMFFYILWGLYITIHLQATLDINFCIINV